MTEDHNLVRDDKYIIRAKTTMPVSERPILVLLIDVTKTTYCFRDMDRRATKFRIMKEEFHRQYDVIECFPKTRVEELMDKIK